VTSLSTLDYEVQNELTVKVKVTDNGSPPLSLEKTIVVRITDVNEKPTAVTLTVKAV
jgi:hypothetical protein